MQTKHDLQISSAHNDFIESLEELYQSGLGYERGDGLQKSLKSAFECYQLAAVQDHQKAQIALAELDKNEIFEFSSYEKSFYCSESMSEQNNQKKLLLLAESYIEEKESSQSIEKALKYYRLAALGGFPYFKQIARKLFQAGIHKKKIAGFLKSILSKDPEIQSEQLLRLSQLFKSGDFLTKSFEAELHFLKLASALGSETAHDFLAMIYLGSRPGFNKNVELAFHYLAIKKEFNNEYLLLWITQIENEFPERVFSYYLTAFQMNPKIIAEHIGRCFEKGIGTEISLKKAIEYYLISYEHDPKSARLNLIKCLDAIGDKESLEKAACYLIDGYERGDEECRYKLAYCYFKGRGVPQSTEKAKELLFDLFRTQFCINEATLLAEVLESFYKIELSIPKDLSIGKRLEELAKIIQEEESAIKCLEITNEFNCLEDANQQLRLAYYYYDSSKYKKTVCLLKKSAEQGLSSAQYALGKCFKSGIGCEKSFSEAVYYFTLAANQEVSEAHFELGFCYEEIKSYKEAIDHFNLASKAGHAKAQILLGTYFEHGKIVKKSLKKAFIFYLKAANQNNVDGLYHVARCYQHQIGVQKSFEKALEYYEKAVALGVQNNVVLQEIEFLKSSISIREKLKIEADNLNPESQFQLFNAYFNGDLGLKKDVEIADNYLQLSADRGFAIAQYILGSRLSETLTTKEKHEEALKYLKQAFDQGYTEAKDELGKCYYMLGQCFELGSGGKRSQEQSIKYYSLALENGYTDAIKKLFECYFFGYGVKESQEEALKYLKLGEQLEDPDCLYQLGKYYEHGHGNLTPCFTKAFDYYKRAADKGNFYAKFKFMVDSRLLHPQAEEINIEYYEKDQKIETLEAIINNYGHTPIFLKKLYFSWEEAQVICRAMIQNPRFTFMCSETEISRLFFAFDLLGYDRETDLKCEEIFSPLINQRVSACVFIGHDFQIRSLNFDSLENLQIYSEELEENKTKAHKLYLTLQDDEIKYPNSEELDVTAYLEDRNIDTLRKIFDKNKDLPIYLSVYNATLEEISVIRDAMIKNPKFTFFCKYPDYDNIEESFYSAGYTDLNDCLKRKVKVNVNGEKIHGILFIGKKIADKNCCDSQKENFG